MLILSSISSGLEFWSVYHTSIYENSELKVLENNKNLGETLNNWPNNLFGINQLNRFGNHCVLVMLILSSISSGLEFWSVCHTSMYENSELKVLKNKKKLGETLNNWPNNLLGTNQLNCFDNHCVLMLLW